MFLDHHPELSDYDELRRDMRGAASESSDWEKQKEKQFRSQKKNDPCIPSSTSLLIANLNFILDNDNLKHRSTPIIGKLLPGAYSMFIRQRSH